MDNIIPHMSDAGLTILLIFNGRPIISLMFHYGFCFVYWLSERGYGVSTGDWMVGFAL